MAKIKDLSGQTFGRLLVVGLSRIYNSVTYWNCICECNKELLVERSWSQIKRAMYPSCGCWEKEEFTKKYLGKKVKSNIYEFFEDYGKCVFGNGKYFIFDLDDYEKIKDFYWSDDGKGYARTHAMNRMLLHRLLMNFPEGMMVDHIDRNTLNNRKNNLRVATPKQNNENTNKRRGKSSKYIGVSLLKSAGLWRAQIGKYFLGCFKEEKDAAIAYNQKARELGYLTRNEIEE